MLSHKIKKQWRWVLGILAGWFLLFLLIPVPDLKAPTSTVLYARDGSLLGAKISTDEQWRFPLCDSVPAKFEQALLLFEDQYFYRHPGINPGSVVRALRQNIRSNNVVSGASTISMQVVRISRFGKSRSITEKLIEAILALRLELSMSKQDILRHYASHAPFGGNVVGVDAAAWRYFGRTAHSLSWAEASTLAVLPNAPSLIFPGKNHHLLLEKRNRLLGRLHEKGHFDELSLQLALQEALPQKPHDLPSDAYHLLMNMVQSHAGKAVQSSIDPALQRQANTIVARHSKQLQANEIHNLCALVLHVESGKVLAYVGNTRQVKSNASHGNDVDVIPAPRSSGSILKHLLYAANLNDGEFLPDALIPDVPIYMDGFAPQNYNLSNEGAVKASQALSRSLNVPAVHMLRSYQTKKFHNLLKSLNFNTIKYSSDHYGLSLILGGAEVTLWDLCRVYRGMAHTLERFCTGDKYDLSAYADPVFLSSDEIEAEPTSHPVFTAAAIYQTFQALQKVNRPDSQAGWENFSSSHKIAWKTGTSYGFRDAWAVGVSPEYVVGVWVGNADGEGRPELSGVTAAAPVMFEIFDYLNPQKEFNKPYEELFPARVCRESGYLASAICEHIDTLEITAAGRNTKPCPYHQLVHLDATGRYRVNSKCVEPAQMIHQSWFVLPPAMAWYYQKKHSSYKALPPYLKGCSENSSGKVLEIVYPETGARLFLPKELSGNQGKIVCEAIHQNDDAKIFWHLDDNFIAETEGNHQIELQASPGLHTLYLIDESGNSSTCIFNLLNAD